MNDRLCRELFIVQWAVLFEDTRTNSAQNGGTWDVHKYLIKEWDAIGSLLFETDATTNWNVGVDLSRLIEEWDAIGSLLFDFT